MSALCQKRTYALQQNESFIRSPRRRSRARPDDVCRMTWLLGPTRAFVAGAPEILEALLSHHSPLPEAPFWTTHPDRTVDR
jgi:hypothetical protein